MIFFESWYSVILFFIIGILIILKQMNTKSDGFNSKFKGYRAGIVALIYSVSLAIAKIMGKV